MTRRRQEGFTLLEIILAMAILALVSASVVGTFMVGLRAWKRSELALDNLQRTTVIGDSVLRCLQGIVFALENRDYYGLYGTDGTLGDYDADEVSFVTRSHRLRSDLGQAWKGPRRVWIFLDESVWGTPALAMSVENPYVLESAGEPEVIPLTRYVRGLNLRYMDPFTGDWLDDWETPLEEEADPEIPVLPGSIEVTLTIENAREGEADLVVTRVADLPIAETVLLDSLNRTRQAQAALAPGGSSSTSRGGAASSAKTAKDAGGGTGGAAPGRRTTPVRIGGTGGAR